ncbi:universal stress protein [Methanosarcina barkeri]
MIGNLGANGLERFLIGSVAEKVVRGSKVPVLSSRVKSKAELSVN